MAKKTEISVFISRKQIPAGEDPYDCASAYIEGEDLAELDEDFDREEFREALFESFAIPFGENIHVTYSDEI
jgi:hypothetical protein